MSRAQFAGELGGAGSMDVIDGHHGITDIFQATGHVGTHPADSDKSDFFKGHEIKVSINVK
jgi:hypothetical protein